MMRRELFDAVGLFDEELPACEDYDLWLRVSARYPVHLIEEPLVVKRGGRPDQLSRQHSLDRYRIQSLAKILRSGMLSDDQAWAARAKLGKNVLFMRRAAANGAKSGRPKPTRLWPSDTDVRRISGETFVSRWQGNPPFAMATSSAAAATKALPGRPPESRRDNRNMSRGSGN